VAPDKNIVGDIEIVRAGPVALDTAIDVLDLGIRQSEAIRARDALDAR
jgi:hypothetical protein